MAWDPHYPIVQLPKKIRKFYTQEADYLYSDLLNNKLTIVLIPAPDPRHDCHMVRAVESENPGWYQGLYSSYNYFRRDRSLMALNRIRNQEDKQFRISPFHYDFIYRDLINDRLIDGFYERGGLLFSKQYC